ncbi:MAG TPA: D-alanine--D-alanine ligase family protein [Rugosimonospora sp.]
MGIRVAVLFGGRSGEHDVSVASAASIVTHLDRATYDITRVLIGRDGRWWIDDNEVGLAEALQCLSDQQVVFPAFHGPYGEDGTVQSLLELLGVRYVGNGVLAGAVGMDKEFTKRLLQGAGLRVADGVVLHPSTDLSLVQQRLRLPVFVKPARAGSSLGVSRVDDWLELPDAVRIARKSDQKVLVESEVRGREIDVAVLQHPDGRVEAGPPLEITVTSGTFFDYNAKYAHGASFQIPARLDPDTTNRLQERALQAFRALDCRGLLRVDFFVPVPEAGSAPGQGDAAAWSGDPMEPVINEVNTFPGFTAQSQYPQIWQQAGISFGDLLDILITGALTRDNPLAGVLGSA